MDSILPNHEIMPFVKGTDVTMLLMGYGSAIVDNVPLVAAAQGMYPVTEVPMDDKLWILLAYTAGTGGSMLIIGSAAGVAAMGMEHIDFMWYFRNVAWKAMLGFLAGAIVFLLMWPLFAGMFEVDPATIINTTIPQGVTGGH
jgi:Na+/H+ antiporter NhaD/arsenite permease-like protein